MRRRPDRCQGSGVYVPVRREPGGLSGRRADGRWPGAEQACLPGAARRVVACSVVAGVVRVAVVWRAARVGSSRPTAELHAAGSGLRVARPRRCRHGADPLLRRGLLARTRSARRVRRGLGVGRSDQRRRTPRRPRRAAARGGDRWGVGERASGRDRSDGHQGGAVQDPYAELGQRHRPVPVVGRVPSPIPGSSTGGDSRGC